MTPFGIFKACVASFLVGAFAAFLIAGALADRQVERVRAFADSTTVWAQAATDSARSLSDSLRAVADSAEARELASAARARASARVAVALDAALSDARTAADSVAIYVPQVEALKAENRSLWDALVQADTAKAALRARGDSLEAALVNVNAALAAVNAQVQGLKPRLPGWLDTGLKVGAGVAAGYALASAR